MIRILLADDHLVVREGLKKIIAINSDMVVAGEASNAQEILNEVSKTQYDVLILDISMPGRNGLDVVVEIKKHYPQIGILVFSIHAEKQFAIRAFKLGCSGYITKSSSQQELRSAIRKVASGGRYITPSVAEELALELDANIEKSLHEKLSNREYQIMCMIASGKSLQEIAGALSLSVHTISSYRSRVLKKMDFKNTSELMHYVIKNDLDNV